MWIIQKLNIYTNTYIEIGLASKGPILSVTGMADARSRSHQRDGVPRVFGIAAELRLAADRNSAHCHRCQRASSMEVKTAFENGQESVIDFGRRLTCHFAAAATTNFGSKLVAVVLAWRVVVWKRCGPVNANESFRISGMTTAGVDLDVCRPSPRHCPSMYI